METFSASLAICAGNSPVPGEFPAQKPETRSFDLHLNKRLSKQSCGCWFKMISRPLWRHCNDTIVSFHVVPLISIFKKPSIILTTRASQWVHIKSICEEINHAITWLLCFSEVWNKCSQYRQRYCRNTLRPRQNGRHFADHVFKSFFLYGCTFHSNFT